MCKGRQVLEEATKSYRPQRLLTRREIGARGADGRRGRDLLIQPSSGPGGGVLVVYGFAPDLVESVDFALAVPPGQVCTPETARDLQEMARKAAAPDVFVLASAPVVDVGQPFTVTLSGVADGELVAFRDGRVVLRQSFAGTRQPTARLRESGRYGIEVWITNSADRSRSVSAVFTEVKAK